MYNLYMLKINKLLPYVINSFLRQEPTLNHSSKSIQYIYMNILIHE